jgi:NOL1/NOP2/fmu family ribosome biogenesis protein
LKTIADFARQFDAKLMLRRDLVVKKNNRYFLVDEKLKPFVSNNFYFAGTYLGKVKKNKFFPSFELLRMIAEKGKANKITINDRTEWLFICGRDVF